MANNKKLSSKNDPLMNALYISEQRSKQTTTNPTNDVVGNISKQTHESLRGNTRGWRSVSGGLAQGINNSANLSNMFSKKEDKEKYNRVLDYMESMNQSNMEKQQYYQKLESARDSIAPEAFAYFQNQNSDPQTDYISGNNMWQKYKELSGANGDFMGWSPTDRNVALIKNADGKVSLQDLRAQFFGPEYNQNEIASVSQGYQNKLQQERQGKAQELALKERKVQSTENVNNKRMNLYDAQINKINNPDIPTEQETFNSLEEVPLATYDAVARRGFVNDARNEVTASKEAQGALRILDELEQLSEKVPNISNLWTRNAPFGALSADQQSAIKKYEKYQSQIAQPIIRARGSNITDAERKIIEQGIPNWDQPLEARKDNIKTKKRELQNLIARGIYAGNALSRKVTPSQLGYENFLSNNPNLVPEGVNPTFTQSSDFRNQNVQQTNNEPYIIEDENGVEHQVTPEQFNAIQNGLQGAR